MMHGPCGSANPKCPCMIRGRCSKYFPKSFTDNTVIDADGYAQYRRRDDKQNVKCGKVFLDNRHVVPYHRGLLVKYQGHINVEWCNRSLAIKYLFKYIGKGPDMATIVLQREDNQPTTGELPSTSRATANERDEVKTYVSCRYVSAAEACWRLYDFPIHHREPFVQRLYFHLENEQEVRFRDDETLPQVDPDASSKSFGGVTILLGGDFRQVLPVVPKKGRADIVGASISKSSLWNDCTVFNLVENMQIEKNVPAVTIDGRKVPFRDWVLALGDGTEQTTNFDDDTEPSWIKIPAEVYLKPGDNPLQTMVNEIYAHLGEQHVQMEYIRDRAILTPLNEYVEAVNNEVLHRLPGELKIYRSYDSVCKSASTAVDEVLYPPEYLNSLKFSGLPNHELQVKVGSPIMLLRNLNPKKSLCNGTRLIVTRCYPFLVETRILTGTWIGDITFIPRINMSPADKTFPAMVKRKQFPYNCLLRNDSE
ncbi:hypothetical protein DCAR_0729362 [Daucus carota subsp. sativus]|uniref:ATP-dependent DNA helicase n=1 Tax=Daucus carota subsp. sativus TaxID=79200 RepID=A0AAF0XMS6_DAUCS|nr:hypothetical protein DCAR_0729362 [Daucus carota subsp. sativus]